jgi:hypothetical protein
MTYIDEAQIENVTWEWLAGVGYTVLPGPTIAPGELAAARSEFDVVVLQFRLREIRCPFSIRDRLRPLMPSGSLMTTKTEYVGATP